MSVTSYPAPSGKGKLWKMSFYDTTGKQHRKQGFATKSEAETFEATLRARDMAGESVTQQTRMTFAEGYAEYGRLRIDGLAAQSKQPLRHAYDKDIVPYFGAMRIRGIRPADVEGWVAWMREGRGIGRPASTKLIRKRWVNLRTLLNFYVKMEWLTKSPMRGLDMPPAGSKAKVTALSIEQVQALANAMHRDRDYALVLFIAFTAMRPGEAFGLHWDDVDIAGGWLHVRHSYCSASKVRKSTKTGEERSVKLGTNALRVISEWRKVAPDTPMVFPARQSRGTGYLGGNWYRDAWAKATKATELDGTRLYDLRHFLPSLLLSKGEPIKAVQDLMGHTTAAMTLDVYGHCMPGEEGRLADALDAAIGEATKQPELVAA